MRRLAGAGRVHRAFNREVPAFDGYARGGRWSASDTAPASTRSPSTRTFADDLLICARSRFRRALNVDAAFVNPPADAGAHSAGSG
jgi:hypothetical protein